MTAYHAIRTLPDGPLDLIGDVHGEIDALESLLRRLGADLETGYATRPLVFVGDLVDRGPDTPAVISLVRRFVDAGNAHLVLGNHELNTLRGDVKPGSSWIFSDRAPFNQPGIGRDRYLSGESPEAARLPQDEVSEVLGWLAEQPLVLERDDLRVVHACGEQRLIDKLATMTDATSAGDAWDRFDDRLRERYADVIHAARDERRAWRRLQDPSFPVDRRLPNHIEITVAEHVENPVRGLVCGLENEVTDGDYRYINGKWRLTERTPWWKTYTHDRAVVVGHYWRRRDHFCGPPDSKPHPWDPYAVNAWSEHQNVFCLDFSVGYRFKERRRGHTGESCHALAALRWPDCELVFDDRDEPIPAPRRATTAPR